MQSTRCWSKYPFHILPDEPGSASINFPIDLLIHRNFRGGALAHCMQQHLNELPIFCPRDGRLPHATGPFDARKAWRVNHGGLDCRGHAARESSYRQKYLFDYPGGS